MSIYCGAGKPKGKQRLGTKDECIEKGQARLYGVHSVGRQPVSIQKNNIVISRKMDAEKAAMTELYFEMVKLKSKINTPADRKKYNQKAALYKKHYDEVSRLYKQLVK